MIPRALKGVGPGLVAVLLSLAWAAPLLAQAEELRQQTLGRPYWHVFLAYAIALILIMGWVISIARRLRRVENRLQSHSD
ncbi:MAG: hypothetical protein P8188_10645 [Gemmatimonadota bacterium]